MRRRLVALAATTTIMVALAFLIPLAVLVRTLARDRALSAAELEAQSLAPVLALTQDTTALDASVLLMPPSMFLKRPVTWLRVMSRHRATHTAAPNFAYDLCARRVRDDQLDGLDLSDLRFALTGAEPVRAASVEGFLRRFAPVGLRPEVLCPGYGLAEATLFVTGALEQRQPVYAAFNSEGLEQHKVVAATTEDADSRMLVGCGRALPEVGVRIVNRETSIACGPDQIGEIWVSGPSVSHGYWNKPEESAETFKAYLVDTGEGPFLRTGDLGFLRDGELFVTGRIKDLIIIRGRNH